MIEKLFTSKNRIKILELLLFSNQSFSMREIERKLNIPVSAVKREIDNLEKLTILKKENGKYSSNQKCTFLESLIDIFLKTDAFKFELETILPKNKINFAFIFGSFSNNEYNIDSDVDLFVIGKIKMAEVIKLVKPFERKIKREVNPVVWSLDNLKSKSNISFVKDIFSKKIMMILGDEHELRSIIKRK